MSTNTLHVVGEIIALTGVVIYFSQKNSTLMKHIDELAARIEEQEDIIQKHEELLNKIVSNIKKAPTPVVKVCGGLPKSKVVEQPKPKSQSKTPPVAHVFTSVPQVFNLSIPTSHSLDVLEEYNNTGITEIEENGNEDELDNEIHEELSELQS